MRALFLAALLASAGTAVAQDWPQPAAEDVATLDGIIKAYYEVVSAPAGQPKQVERDHSLHHPKARVAITGKDENGKAFIRMMTLDEYYKDNVVSTTGFFEKESL